MKLRNIEDGQEVVYVQKRDINECLKRGYEFSSDLEEQIPFSENPILRTAEKYEDALFKNTLRNKTFIRLTNQKDIKKINETDWIVDFAQLYALSIPELNAIIEKLETETLFIKDDAKETLSHEKAKNLLNKAKRNTYIIGCLNEILGYKLLEESIPFPSVPNNIALDFPVSSDKYIIKHGLNPEEVFVTKKSGLPFTKFEEVPKRLITEIVAFKSVMLQENGDYLTKMNLDYYLSEDHKTLVITLNKTIEFEERKAEILDFKKEYFKLKLKRNINTIKSEFM